jgi:hypothetical protein
MDSTATVPGGSMYAINAAIFLLFLALAALASVLALVLGRIFYKRWYSFLRIFLNATLGGLVALAIFRYAAELESVRNDQALGSFNRMLQMIALVLLPLMLLLPLVSITLRHQSMRIKVLQEEVNVLKTKLTQSNPNSSSILSTTEPQTQP